MFMIPPDVPPQDRVLATIFALIVLGAFVLGFFYIGESIDERHAKREALERAGLTLWVAECRTYNPIEACASAWDRSRALRELYQTKAGAP